MAKNIVILEKPQKPKKILFETPDPSKQSPSCFKDTGLFLSPATQKNHDNRNGNQVVRSGLQFTDIEEGAKEHN